MREQAKTLEDHADLLLAELHQRLAIQAHHIHIIDQNLPGCRFDQAVEMADQGGLARTGQTHDDVNAAMFNGQADVT